MPIGAWAHIAYWSGSKSAGPGPSPQSDRPSYPAWDTTILGSGFGPLQSAYERCVALWRIWRLFLKLPRDRRRVALHALALMGSDYYAVARACVKETATTLGYNNPANWAPMKQELQGDQGRTENLFRHVRAMRRFEMLEKSTLTNPDLNLLIELAYHGYARDPQRPEAWRSPSQT